MYKTFASYRETAATEDDEIIAITVQLNNEDNDQARLKVKKSTAIAQVTGDPRKKSVEEIVVSDLNVENLDTIVSLIVEFLQSESKATISEAITNVSCTYERKLPGDKLNEEKKEFGEFDSFLIAIGERDLLFKMGDETLTVPSAKDIYRGQPKDFKNIDKINRVFYDFITNRYSGDSSLITSVTTTDVSESAVNKIECIFDRFGHIVAPLQSRRDDRQPLLMEDEYDVQYLLHGLLKLHFDTVLDESYLEQHGTINPRIDFLIPTEQIGIETKRPSENRTEKTIQSEISESKEKNRTSQNCEVLLVFVYDPDKEIHNPMKFEADLSGEADNLDTKVTVIQ